MDFQSASFCSDNAKQTRKTMRRRGLRYMSDSQIQAYLIARDLVRRIQQASSFGTAPSARGKGPT